jgi:S1-C subfamily serine protease
MRVKYEETHMKLRLFASGILTLLLIAGGAFAQEKDPEIEKAKEIEKCLVEVVARCRDAFVNFGGGSGVCISEDGLVVTNFHVAGRSKNWTLKMPGGAHQKKFSAKILWGDPTGDIALLKIDNKGEKLPFVPLGDSDAVKVGQLAFAMGTPFMTAQEDSIPTITFGVVSAVHRYQGGYSDAIQTDASVNPGNSGGPLIDLQGRLIGINGQIRVRFPYRVNTGIGLAVPVNQIRNFMEAFKDVDDGRTVQHGIVNGLTLSKEGEDGKGARVENVEKDSTADKAGFKPGDFIVKVNNYEVFNHFRFLGIIGTYPEGAKLNVTVKREEGEKVLEVVLDKFGTWVRETRGPVNPKAPFLGVQFSPVPHTDGVQVEQVFPNTPAAKAGIQANDVITHFDGQKVEDVEQFRRLIANKKPGDKVKIKILREGEEKELEVTLEERGNR